MLESHDARSAIDAAERAASAGDYASAEQLLREAALQQEADFGPLAPDLANTLNNLGVVYEITDKPGDAERCYQKAYAIATAVLEPDHPFVATSRQNLEDFYKARGKTIEPPTPSPADALGSSHHGIAESLAAEQEPRVVVSATASPSRPSHVESRRFAFRRSAVPLAIGASLCGLVVVLLIATRPWFRWNGQAATAPVGATESLPASPAPTREPVEPIEVPKTITTNTGGPAVAPRSRAGAASVPKPAILAFAQLCRDLSTGGWRCAPARSPIESGALFFYTRVKSPNDTTVQHRWYRDDQLHQAVDLRIGANQNSGYRTYSRYTVNNRSAGTWRVELRSRDGVLLHEERFVVR